MSHRRRAPATLRSSPWRATPPPGRAVTATRTSASAIGDWSHRVNETPLRRFLAEEIGLPQEEARSLADAALEGFRERGGEETLRPSEYARAGALLSFEVLLRYILPVVALVAVLVVLARLVI